MLEQNNIQAKIEPIKSLSFDCYGTLIDWESGIRGAFEQLTGDGALAIDRRAFFDTYLAAEAGAEAGDYMSYRQVLSCVQGALADQLGISFGPEQADLLADSHAAWKPYADTNAALVRLKSRYKLIILSNVDRDLFQSSADQLSVAFDQVITAEDVRSYKPADPHFHRLLESEVIDPSRHIHVAQSLFHDGVPAARLGIPFIWINRRAEVNGTCAQPLLTCRNLAELADHLST